MKIHRPIRKLLAANRSEIAIRIFRAANELGLRTVAIYSQEDRLALHRFKADEAYQVGAGKGPVEAYLDIAGHHCRRQGTGSRRDPSGLRIFVRESRVRRACDKAGIAFIGPTPDLLELLGDKTAARRLAASAGVSGASGDGRPVSLRRAKRTRLPLQIGFPVIVKAAMGGGGRGMRVVHDASGTRSAAGRSSGRSEVRFRRRFRLSGEIPCPRPPY